MLASHDPQPQPVSPGQEEAKGDLGPVHGGDPPLVDLEDAVAAAEATLPGGTRLGHTRIKIIIDSDQVRFKTQPHLDDMNTRPKSGLKL